MSRALYFRECYDQGMVLVLAYADSSDQSSSSLVTVFISACLILLVCGLAFLPVCLAWWRRHGRAESVVALALLWGLISAASLMNASVSQISWSREQMIRIQSGYYDAQDLSGAPKIPWALWSVLVVAYFAMILWAVRGRQRVVAGARGAAGEAGNEVG